MPDTPTLAPGQTWTPTKGRAKARYIEDACTDFGIRFVSYCEIGDAPLGRDDVYPSAFRAWITRTGAVCRDAGGEG